MQTSANAHPLGQIVHTLQAFCPNGLIHYFLYAVTGRCSLLTSNRLKLFRRHRYESLVGNLIRYPINSPAVM